MEEKKNNKALIWLIVILIILVLVLVGYIIYGKVLVDDKETSNENTSTTITTTINNSTTTKTQNENVSLNNFPQTNDDDVKFYGDIFDLAKNYLSTNGFEKFKGGNGNFKDLEFNIENTKINLSCINYDENNEVCYKKTINLDNKIILSFEDYVNYNGVYILKTEKYYIVQYGNGVTIYDSIYVYDNNGKELIKTEATTIYTTNSNIEKYATIYENKLYFIKHINCKNILSYIDLNKSDLNITELDTESTEGINEC